MNKTLRAFVLPFLLFFTLSTVTAPARAVLPVIASGLALLSEGSTVANGLAAMTVGTVAGMVYLSSLEGGSGSISGSIMDIPLGVGRDRPMSTPAGYTAPANNNAQPTPPSSASVSGYTVTTDSAPIMTTTLPDLTDASWKAFGNTVCAAIGAGKTMYSPCVGNTCSINCTMGGSNTAGVTSYNCASGYSFNGSTCTLTNAASVQKPADGRCEVLASVSGYEVDPQDPECGELASKGIKVGPNEISFEKPGTLTNGKVTRNADGSRTITYSKVNSDNITTTITTVNLLPADPVAGTNATVTGTSVVVVNGTGTNAGTTPTTPKIEFPTDYNKETTQEQIKSGIDALHDDLDSTDFTQPTAPPVPSDLALAENKKITDELGTTVTTYDNFKMLDWSTWIPTLPASSCAPFTGSVLGRPVSIDLCPKIAMLNELIGWLLSVFALWSVVSMMFRKD